MILKIQYVFKVSANEKQCFTVTSGIEHIYGVSINGVMELQFA